MPTHVETLENGLKVVLRPIPDTKALSTWVVYRIGSRNEVPGMTGSTHWVEHMLFKGGGKLAKGDIDTMISRLGGKMNAFTDTDYTMYFETIPAAAMDTALMIESERMRNAAFDPLQTEAPPDPLRLAEPEQRGERRSDLERPGPADLLSVGWHIPGAAHEDTPALVLLATVLGGWRGFVPFAAGDWRPRSNRLYRALVDAKLATDVGVRLESKLDPSLLVANATLAPGASLDRVEAVLDRGIAAEGSEFGLAEFTSRLLLSGTRRMGTAKLADRLEGIGATLEFRNGDEVLSFQGRCTRETAAETVRILVDCLSEPAFPSKEVERIRAELQNDLRIEADDTHHRAVREVSRLVFPKDHPYGREPKGDPSRVRRIRRGDIVSFHEAHVGPEGLILAVTGDVDRALIDEGIAAPLSRLRGDRGAEAIPPPPPHRPGSVHLPMPHKSQVDIVIGAPGVPRRHEDYYALNLANLLFGRIGLYGRFVGNLRHEQGLAYYPFSSLDARTAGGMGTISAGVNPANFGKALESSRGELGRLRTEPFSLHEIRG